MEGADKTWHISVSLKLIPKPAVYRLRQHSFFDLNRLEKVYHININVQLAMISGYY